MIVVMGASGHVGAAVIETLGQKGTPAIAVGHRGSTGTVPNAAQTIDADASDPDSLRFAFRRGRRAFLLNPPADVSLDTDVIERRSVAGILAALEESGLDKVVAASTAGAQPGDHLGDLGVLWEFESGLAAQSIPVAVNRGAYYYSNWDSQIESARSTGELRTLFPADLAIPMVAPEDLGKAAAERLLSGLDDVGVRLVEGPERLSSLQVSRTFSRVLGRDIRLVVTPRTEWEASFQRLGFSDAAARSYAAMTAATVDRGFEPDDGSWRWPTTFDEYLRSKIDPK